MALPPLVGSSPACKDTADLTRWRTESDHRAVVDPDDPKLFGKSPSRADAVVHQAVRGPEAAKVYRSRRGQKRSRTS